MACSPPASYAASHTNNVPLFQPPKSPASLTTTPAFATATDYFGPSSKKRQRPESRDEKHSHSYWAETSSWAQCPTPSDGLFGSAYGQDSGLVNERYRLAGGFDTPALERTARLEQLTVDEYEFRRKLRNDDMGMGNSLRGDCAPVSGPLARERNGVARVPPTVDAVTQETTWTSFAFGLVGKVFSFGGSVVRGFYAGGGQGYDFKQYPVVGSDLLDSSGQRTSTPLPGSWVQEDFLGDFEQDSPSFIQQSSASRPPNKRRQTMDGWIVVGSPDLDAAPFSPKRKTSGNNVPRSSLAARPQASRASSRKSIAPVPRRTTSYVTANGSPAQPQIQTQSSHTKRASLASTRSPQGHTSVSAGAAWMSPEAERYAKRQSKQDKTISNLGRRMEEMIRQAQEALNTKFSVEGDVDMEDEGYVDDD